MKPRPEVKEFWIVENAGTVFRIKPDHVYTDSGPITHVISADYAQGLERDLAIAKEALKFYADRSSWYMREVNSIADSIQPADRYYMDESGIHVGGKTAQEALRKIEESKDGA